MWSRTAITFVNALVVDPIDGICDSIRVDRGRIAGLGTRAARGDRVVDLQGAVVFPGLINAHDHLELNSFGRMKWRERYDNVREWIDDFQPRFDIDPRLASARADTLHQRLWIGGLKNMLAGVTTVCHHNPIYRDLRRRFPVRVLREVGVSHSLHIDGARVAAAYHATPREWPWIVHAAEGIDEAAAQEVDTLRALGCLSRNTVLVHGVGLGTSGAEQVLDAGGSLVWCPSSNQFLFGRTADVQRFSAARRLAIGTDSRLSGAGDLLDELRAARAERQVSA
jgi:cytosine/adenosine deaminase-related metal-dependent hydrolase